MDKIRIDIPDSVYGEWMEAGELFGQKVMVRKRIRYEDMVEFATEYAQYCCVIDTDAQVAYESNEQSKAMNYLKLKYYSNIDVDAQEDPMSYASDIIGFLGDNVFKGTNVFDATALAEWFMVNTIEIYNRYHSLSTKILKSFGAILNSEDLKALETSILAGLKEKMLQGVTLKANDNFDGGFRIAVNNGSAYYDYSAEAVVEMMSGYLSPKVTQLLKEAE